MVEQTTVGPIDTVDQILRAYLDSIKATAVAIDIVLALRRNGHLKGLENENAE